MTGIIPRIAWGEEFELEINRRNEKGEWSDILTCRIDTSASDICGASISRIYAVINVSTVTQTPKT